MKQKKNRPGDTDTKQSIKNASYKTAPGNEWQVSSGLQEYVKAEKIEKVDIIRKGIPYGSIEVISKKLNRPVKSVLSIVGLPQTTYNKKKNENSLLNSKESELVLSITELIDYGLEVFNNEEEKFQRWLKKPNLSLAGNAPESMLDTITGIHEVKFSLNRLDFGNLA
jgi:putative toxin-antitoxin system antitoxin component (TIGR02293 family)